MSRHLPHAGEHLAPGLSPGWSAVLVGGPYPLGSPHFELLYESARGRMENLIKDSKRYTRSACSRWQAQPAPPLLHMGACWLLHALRRAASDKKGTGTEATVAAIRATFVRIAMRVDQAIYYETACVDHSL